MSQSSELDSPLFDPPQVTRGTYFGIFCITLATVAYQIVLTRIFSVVLWYHFAFYAISLAMFGMTVGAVVVFLLPHFFPNHRLHAVIGQFSLLFGIGTVFGYLSYLSVPFFLIEASAQQAFSMFLNYILLTLPFFCSGIAVCLVLTRFSQAVSTLYAVDLMGAGIGCALIVPILAYCDAPSTVFLVGAVGCVGSYFFLASDPAKPLTKTALIFSLGLFLIGIVSAVSAAFQAPIFSIPWENGDVAEPVQYERWNSFSRVAVYKDRYEEPFGWGMSEVAEDLTIPPQMKMTIDGVAGTPLTQFSGDLSEIEHLRYDVTNLVHYIRPDSDVLVIGVGGGRDVLSALAFDQKSVTGVEYNPAVLETTNGPFGEFTGHLDQHPKVKFRVAEARSFLASSNESYDIIQISLIDTWAATAAGAFVFSENALYTEEAFAIFLERLSDNGILSVSRWHFESKPAEMYRLVALASKAIRDFGITDPRKHLLVVSRLYKETDLDEDSPTGVGTLLLSKTPFREETLEKIRAVSDRLQFDPVVLPESALDPFFEEIIAPDSYRAAIESYDLNIEPPSDDKPFFFHTLRMRDSFAPSDVKAGGGTTFNVDAITMLSQLILVVSLLTLACVFAPLHVATQRGSLHGSFPLLFYFGGIGTGFMVIEIAEMQRLNIFLGHPVYGFSVILFTLLVGSGLGSLSTSSIENAGVSKTGVKRFLVLLLSLVVIHLLTSVVTEQLEANGTAVRIAASVALLFPLGFFLGMAFPIGMKMADQLGASSLTPWFWGVNGAASVFASVATLAVSLTFGIGASYWLGVICYLISFISLLLAKKVSENRDTIRS